MPRPHPLLVVIAFGSVGLAPLQPLYLSSCRTLAPWVSQRDRAWLGTLR